MRTLIMFVGLSLVGCPAPQSDTRGIDMRPDVDATDARPLDARIADATLADAGPADAAGPADGGFDAADTGEAVDASVVDEGADAAPPPGCARYGQATVAGRIVGPVLAEASGVAASRQSPGTLWIHNDSGNAAALYAVSTDGVVRGWIPLPAAADLEDIAIARCPAAERWCIWVADIGDNAEVRDDVRIFVVPEPPVRDGEMVVDGITTLSRTYPDRPHDAEALMVAEDGQRFWIITK
ncbi:MAG: hypothetical protein ACI9U2_002589, partial [Bradymonadia bacterium]